MDRTSLLPSNEGQSPTSRPSRNSVEDTELRNYSHGRSISPLSSLASTTYYPGGSGGREEAAPAYTPIDSRPQHLGAGRQSRKSSNLDDSCIQRLWLWEALSIAVAALALVAIIITLVLRQDRPLPKWPSAITINALIAVFTAVFKACLMMPIAEGIGQLKWLWYQKSRSLRHMEQWDLASRGPWGSLLLIFVLKSRDLAVIGAILTIVAMAVDPFTQQIVQFYSCSMIVEGESATVPFSNNYTAGYSAKPAGTPQLAPQMDSQMNAAIYIGLVDPLANTSTALKFGCRTGNCTFPSANDGASFLSLALESHCADITRDLNFSVGTRNYTDGLTKEKVTRITYDAILPGRHGTHLENDEWQVMATGSEASTDWPASFLKKVSYIMTSMEHQSEPNYTRAFDCEFYPAVNTYSSNITNGVLSEQVLDSQPMKVWPVEYGTHAMLIVNKTIRAGEWHECISSPDPSDEQNLPVSFVLTPYALGPMVATNLSQEELTKPHNNITWWPQDCVYWLPYQISESLSKAITDLIGSGVLSYNTEMDRASGLPWLVGLWNNGTPTLDTVQTTMDGMTRSVTARLRQGDGISVNAGPAHGAIWGVQTCVHVNWVWLALPAGLLLLTIVFLVLTILRTRSKQARVWKSSVLPVLFSGLDQETRKSGGPVVSLEEMKTAAERATVRLEDTKEGYRLVSQT